MAKINNLLRMGSYAGDRPLLDGRVAADEGRPSIFAHSQFGGVKRACNHVGNRRCGQTMSAVKICFTFVLKVGLKCLENITREVSVV